MSNQYEVYGIGNAIVDIDFEVTDETLTRLNIDKGLMTLIEADRHAALLEELDGIKHVQSPGGSCANTMLAFSQFGGKGFYSCKVSEDKSGIFFVQDLNNHGIDTNHNAVDPNNEFATGKCLVLITPDAERTMNTYVGAAQTLTTAQIDEKALANSEYIYVEGYLVASPSTKAAAIHATQLAKQHGVKTSLTLSDPNMTKFFKEDLKEIIGDGIDFLFCNHEEALSFTEADTLNDAIESLKQYATQFAMTKGAEGAIIFDGQNLIEVEAVSVQAIDTVGAGDMFAAGILYGLTHDLPLQDAGRLASIAAAEVIKKYGPRLTLNESDKVLKLFHKH